MCRAPNFTLAHFKLALLSLIPAADEIARERDIRCGFSDDESMVSSASFIVKQRNDVSSSADTEPDSRKVDHPSRLLLSVPAFELRKSESGSGGSADTYGAISAPIPRGKTDDDDSEFDDERAGGESVTEIRAQARLVWAAPYLRNASFLEPANRELRGSIDLLLRLLR